MANFCTNCGAKIRKDDNFCTSCGTKLKNDNNFCMNCGAKIGKEDKFCMNCGAKIDRSDIKQKKTLLKSVQENMEKSRVKTTKEKVKIPKEINRKKTGKTKTVRGGHCNLNCRHCYEEFLDSCGGLVGDFDSEGYTEYYCRLGHSLSFGSFCEDYE